MHFGKSHMFSSSFVELDPEQEQIIFLSKKEKKWRYFAQRTFSYGHARDGVGKNNDGYIYFFKNSKLEIKVILK